MHYLDAIIMAQYKCNIWNRQSDHHYTVFQLTLTSFLGMRSDSSCDVSNYPTFQFTFFFHLYRLDILGKARNSHFSDKNKLAKCNVILIYMNEYLLVHKYIRDFSLFALVKTTRQDRLSTVVNEI